jgi:hypothetical protein
MTQEIRSEVGRIRTGIMMSPLDAKNAIVGAANYTTPLEGDSSLIGDNRIQYMGETGALGTVPLPTTPRGPFASLTERVKTGGQPFLDKLGERIAFERTGTRL